jgi:hypothetical protein
MTTKKLVAIGATVVTLGMIAWAAVVVGCNDKKGEFDGVGKWRFGHTTLKQATGGVCQPTDLNDGRKATWCFSMPPFKVGSRVAEVDLYFLGTTPDAPLIEIQLKIRGCIEQEVEQWMRTGFGPPIEMKATRGYWKNPFLWAAALMPSEPGRCLIHFLPLSENAEIERIKLK